MPPEITGPQTHERAGDEDLGDNRSEASTTSTDAYSEHESFETYQHRVLELCRLLWPDSPDESFDIQRLEGGSSNRIIRIQVSGHGGNSSHPEPATAGRSFQGDTLSELESLPLRAGDYILRVPRWDGESCKHDVAMLRFISNRVSYPVPTVVYSDFEGKNPIGSPFVLQHRIPGRRLDQAWALLSQPQRCLIALDMARLCNELVKITNPTGGRPVLNPSMPDFGSLETIDYPFPGDQGQKEPTNSHVPVSMLGDRLGRWFDKYPPDADEFSPYKGAMEMVQHMQDVRQTFQPSDPGQNQPLFYLNHGDLFPRNIMIETLSQNTACITGIIDWDSADFAPAIISLSPPAWLWKPGFWKEDGDSELIEEEDLWQDAHAEPDDEESRELKGLFDASVTPLFLQHAYSPDAYAARKIWNAAYESMGKSWVEDGLTNMYQEWKASGQEEKEGDPPK
jgi:aminoglycoside phosphotransferase (APT) family kinase protein